jgi:hypothetical protein
MGRIIIHHPHQMHHPMIESDSVVRSTTFLLHCIFHGQCRSNSKAVASSLKWSAPYVMLLCPNNTYRVTIVIYMVFHWVSKQWIVFVTLRKDISTPLVCLIVRLGIIVLFLIVLLRLRKFWVWVEGETTMTDDKKRSVLTGGYALYSPPPRYLVVFFSLNLNYIAAQTKAIYG